MLALKPSRSVVAAGLVKAENPSPLMATEAPDIAAERGLTSFFKKVNVLIPERCAPKLGIN